VAERGSPNSGAEKTIRKVPTISRDPLGSTSGTVVWTSMVAMDHTASREMMERVAKSFKCFIEQTSIG
jgi:hypothetical protein